MIEITAGKPIRVGERELQPLVRVETRVQRRAFVGAGEPGGHGRGYVHMRPLGIREWDAAGTCYIPIHDRTAQMIGGLILAAFVIPLLLALAVNLARVQNRVSRRDGNGN